MKAKKHVEWIFFPFFYYSCWGHTCVLLPANVKSQDFLFFFFNKSFSSRIELHKFHHPSKLSLIMFDVTDLNKTLRIQENLPKKKKLIMRG